jgi:hypothetical protein
VERKIALVCWSRTGTPPADTTLKVCVPRTGDVPNAIGAASTFWASRRLFDITVGPQIAPSDRNTCPLPLHGKWTAGGLRFLVASMDDAPALPASSARSTCSGRRLIDRRGDGVCTFWTARDGL